MHLIGVMIFLAMACVKLEAYKTHHLETICNLDDEGKINIPAWGAAILKLGHQLKYSYTPAGTWAEIKVGECTVNVETEEGFSLALVIEDMNIRGIKDRTRNKMDCSDYVRFSTVGKVKSLFNKITPGNPFKSRESNRLCGKTHNAGDNIKDIKLEDISTSDGQGNVFFTKNSNIEVVFHQNQHPYQTVNNSFTLVLTAYKYTTASCEGRFRCSDSDEYCINEAFQCDNHINCAFPTNGRDEDPRVCPVEQQSTLSTVTTIIIILACISGAALLLFSIYVLKSKRKVSTDYEIDNNNDTQTAMRQQSLPMYEAVIALDAENSDTTSIGPTPADPKDVPPSYEQLFPDGPPKDEEGVEDSTATGPSDADPAPPPGTIEAEENTKIPVIGFANIS